jgi:hypothetical protein
LSAIQNPASHYVGLSGKKQGIEPGFPLNEGQIKILNGGFRLDVATTPRRSFLPTQLSVNGTGKIQGFLESHNTPFFGTVTQIWLAVRIAATQEFSFSTALTITLPFKV